MVDCTGLENRRTERYRGFESLSLRFIFVKPADFQWVLIFIYSEVPVEVPECYFLHRNPHSYSICFIFFSLSGFKLAARAEILENFGSKYELIRWNCGRLYFFESYNKLSK